MSDLSTLCRELHERLLAGEPWEGGVKTFVLTHPDLFKVAKRLASRYGWIDPSLSENDLAHTAIAEGWLDYKQPPSENSCVGGLITALKRWTWRVPGKRRKRKGRDTHEELVNTEVVERLTDQAFEKVNYYNEGLLLGMVIGWIRKYKVPKRTIAMLRFEQNLKSVSIAVILGKREATISEHVAWIRTDLADRIRRWQEEG